MFIELSLD